MGSAVSSPQDFQEEHDCAICLTRLDGRNEATYHGDCPHRFHLPCIAKWMEHGRSCPVCRTPVHPVLSDVLVGAATPLPPPVT